MNATLTFRERMDDRFSVALIIALLLHAAVLLGVGFTVELAVRQQAAESLDVVLVNYRSETEPEEAEFLAQVSQAGGGEFEEVEKPSQDLSPELPSLAEGDMPMSSTDVLPAPAEDARERVTMVTETARESMEDTEIEQEVPDIPSSAELMQQSMQAANLQPTSDRRNQWKSKLKRREYISANTKEYEYATYMAAWVAKVERVGNLNYPSELRQRKVAGDLLMTVGVNLDGSVESISVRRSSGLPELDQAAMRIVRLAAPYSPLPAEMAEKIDVLHITRTWRFSAGNRFE
jgi:protein TonB